MRLRLLAPLAVLLAACVAAPAPVHRASPAVRAAPLQEEEAAEEGPEAGEWTTSVFVGGAGQLNDEYGTAWGLDVEYRVGPRWGVAAFAEAVTGVERVFAGGALAFVNPVGGWSLLAGPGMERADGEWSPIWRVGTSYEIRLAGGWLVTPSVYFDFSEHEDLLVYGAALGRSW
jgi:hypothetical protein